MHSHTCALVEARGTEGRQSRTRSQSCTSHKDNKLVSACCLTQRLTRKLYPPSPARGPRFQRRRVDDVVLNPFLFHSLIWRLFLTFYSFKITYGFQLLQLGCCRGNQEMSRDVEGHVYHIPFFLMFVRIPHAVYVFEQLVHTHIYVFMNYAREQHLYVSITSEMYVSTYI